MTYRGDRATIQTRTSTLLNASAFNTATLIMFQKIANVLSIISFIMVAFMSGGTYFAYKYVTSEQFQTKMMNKLLGGVQGMMPKVLEKGLPDLIGPSLPIPPTMGESKI